MVTLQVVSPQAIYLDILLRVIRKYSVTIFGKIFSVTLFYWVVHPACNGDGKPSEAYSKALGG